MEGNKKTGNSQNKPNESNKEATSKIQDTASTKKKTSQSENNYSVKSKDGKIRSNYWAGYKEPLVVATLLLFIVTGFLYHEASKYGKDASESARAANEAADVAKNTLDDNRKEFEELNRPDLLVTDFGISKFKENTSIRCSCKVVNTGKFRAKIKAFSLFEHVGTDTFHYTGNGVTKTPIQNELLPFNSQLNVSDMVLTNKSQKDSILNGNMAIFINCDYEYCSEYFNKCYDTHILYKLHYIGDVFSSEKIYLREIIYNF